METTHHIYIKYIYIWDSYSKVHVVVFWKSVFVPFFADALCEDVIFSDIGIDDIVTFQHSMGGSLCIKEQLYRHDLSCGPLR